MSLLLRTAAFLGSAFSFAAVAQTVHVLETRADKSALLAPSEASFTSTPAPGKAVTLRIFPGKPLQPIEGFGASLTGSSASLLQQLAPSERDAVMHTLFAPSGPLGLTLLRQPLAASDFSAHGNYSYDDPPNGTDPELTHFSLGVDATETLPLLRQAQQLNPQLRVIALPWSAPAWMKSSHTMNGGTLDPKWTEAYARYLLRSLSAYANAGIPIAALALQNEPENENLTYPTQLMSPAQEITLAQAVRPVLRRAGFPTLLLGYEHNWSDVDYPKQLLAQPGLFDAISFHCYRGNEAAQLSVLEAFPRASLWFTECSGETSGTFAGDFLWQAQHLLLGAPLHGARSVLLWNLVLRPDGGPHNGGCNNCRALLTLEHRNGAVEWTRNPEFYLLAHAAPFVHPGAHLLTTSAAPAGLELAAFRNPDDTFAVLALNSSTADLSLQLEVDGATLEHRLARRSLVTFTWGTPRPVLSAGLYRLRDSAGLCLESNTSALAHTACSASPAQLWNLTALSRGRSELRNVATRMDLALGTEAQPTQFAVDGDHTVPLELTLSGASVCLVRPGSAPCPAAQTLTFEPPSLDKIR